MPAKRTTCSVCKAKLTAANSYPRRTGRGNMGYCKTCSKLLTVINNWRREYRTEGCNAFRSRVLWQERKSILMRWVLEVPEASASQLLENWYEALGTPNEETRAAFEGSLGRTT